MARAAYEAALSYAREREGFGKPIYERRYSAIPPGRHGDPDRSGAATDTCHAAAMKDAGFTLPERSGHGKLFASEMAEEY